MVKNLPAKAGDRCGFSLWVGKIPWSRKWQPTSVFLPGESHEQRSLVGYSPWGHKESKQDWGDLAAAACVLFYWSGTSVSSQLVFCMYLCVWRCSPDVIVERDVLHVHLLLRHLVLDYFSFITYSTMSLPSSSACQLSCFRHVWFFVTLWTVAHQASLFMGFSRQEYTSGLPFPSPGITVYFTFIAPL